MPHFVINQIGPIDHVEFTLSKLNVIIGPQSSGKSTIAKIISFCLWLEKELLMHRDVKLVDRAFIEKELLGFHKLRNYLNEGYTIHFDGEVVIFHFDEVECNVLLKDEIGKCKVGKVAYIPAERIAVTLPNIVSLKMPEINTRSFLFDWLEIHQKFQKKNAVDLLKLKMKYYYDEFSQKDMIVLENGKEIMLEEASSGLQSVVPLYVYMYYLTHWVYDHQEDISFEKKKQLEEILVQEYAKKLIEKNTDLSKDKLEKYANNLQVHARVKRLFNAFKQLEKDEIINSENRDTFGIEEDILKLEDNISHPHYSNIILEEPELNLFPETQKELMYDVLEMINNERDHLVITTHSPYLLYALNNCMLGYLVKDKIPAEDEELQTMEASFINPDSVSVWEIKDGRFAAYKDNPNNTIQDERGLIRANYFDRIMKNIMVDFSSLMDYYDED